MSHLVVTSYGDPRESVSLEQAPGLLLGTDDILVEMEAAPVNRATSCWYRATTGSGRSCLARSAAKELGE